MSQSIRAQLSPYGSDDEDLVETPQILVFEENSNDGEDVEDEVCKSDISKLCKQYEDSVDERDILVDFLNPQIGFKSNSVSAAAPSAVLHLPIDPRIQTVRISLILDKPSKDKYSEHHNQIRIEVKAKDRRFKELGKKIILINNESDLFEQLESSEFLRGFQPINEKHLVTCLFPAKNGNNKPTKIVKQHLKYYITKNEEGEYHGQINGNKTPEGNGIVYYRNGNKYQGMIKNRLRHGQGILIWPDGSSYEGEWKNDQQYGFGKSINSSSDEIFEGNFIDNVKEGFGRIVTQKYILEGSWKRGLSHGISTMTVNEKKIKMLWEAGVIIEIDGKKVNADCKSDHPVIKIQINNQSRNITANS